MRRRGYTLVEVLFFSGFTLFIVGMGWTLIRSGSIRGSHAHQGLNLQQGVRNFMENLVKDVNAAAVIAEPNALTPMPANRVVLWVFSDALEDEGGMIQPGRRLELNGGPDSGISAGVNPWPFSASESDTNWALPVLQVTYTWDEASGVVTREAVPGALVAQAPQAGAFVRDYSFSPAGGGAAMSRRMSDNIKEFTVYPFGYDELDRHDDSKLGKLKPTAELPDYVSGAISAAAGPVVAGFQGGSGASNVGQGPRQARTAMLLVKVKAIYDYAKADLDDPEIELATKIWSYAKLTEHRYFPYFSSVDDDLRF